MNQIIKKKNKKKAFTLIELIIVLAIMAIIAAIAIPNFMAVRDNSRVKADTQSCETIKRTTLMLVSDGTLAAGTKTFDITVTSGVVAVAAGNASYSSDEAALTTAFKDVKAPQGNTLSYASGKYSVVTPTAVAGKYHISIDTSGNVTMTTIGA